MFNTLHSVSFDVAIVRIPASKAKTRGAIR
jgi:hypothetical protein